MKTLKILFTLSLIALANSMFGWFQPRPCQWEFEVEYLYLKPMVSESYYAVDINIPTSKPNGNRYNNDFNFHSAYRLKADYAFGCGNDIKVVWTHLPQIQDKDSVFQDFSSGTTLTSTTLPVNIVFANSASSKIKFEYYAVEALFGLWKWHQPRWKASVYSGLHYANLHFKETLNYVSILTNPTPLFTIINKSRVRGIGPELTFDYIYNLPCQIGFRGHQLSFVSHLSTALLASRYTIEVDNLEVVPGEESFAFAVKDQKRWDLVPFWDIRLGFSYTMPFNCFCVDLEVGYEMFSYHNGVDRIRFVNEDAPGISIDKYSDANFQGPYVALAFAF